MDKIILTILILILIVLVAVKCSDVGIDAQILVTTISIPEELPLVEKGDTLYYHYTKESNHSVIEISFQKPPAEFIADSSIVKFVVVQ